MWHVGKEDRCAGNKLLMYKSFNASTACGNRAALCTTWRSGDMGQAQPASNTVRSDRRARPADWRWLAHALHCQPGDKSQERRRTDDLENKHTTPRKRELTSAASRRLFLHAMFVSDCSIDSA